jgi:hypothetical protein
MAENLIVFNPQILGGNPCVRGTRLSVELLIELAAGGATREQILTQYPHLTPEGLAGDSARRVLLRGEQTWPGTYNGHWSDHGMRISTAREFRDTTALLRSRTPVLVTRRGRVAGIFFPRPELTLPIELKRELYDMLSSDLARQLKRRKVSEDDVLKDFEASRKKRRAARRRR